MAATKGHLAGFYEAQICYRDTVNGYPTGTTANWAGASNGTVTHAYRLFKPVSASALAPTYDTAEFRGGQGWLGSVDLGLSTIGTFEMTLSGHDDTFHSIVSGSSVDTTIASSYSVTAPNVGLQRPPQLYLILTVGYQKEDGTNWFMHYGYSNVQIRRGSYGQANMSGGENPNPLTYTVRVSKSSRTMFGYPFSSTTLAVTDNSDIGVEYKTENRISISTYKDDGAATSFVVGYRPINSENAGAVNSFTKNGAINHTGVSGFSTTTGATTHTAGTAADTWVVVYDTNFVAI